MLSPILAQILDLNSIMSSIVLYYSYYSYYSHCTGETKKHEPNR